MQAAVSGKYLIEEGLTTLNLFCLFFICLTVRVLFCVSFCLWWCNALIHFCCTTVFGCWSSRLVVSPAWRSFYNNYNNNNSSICVSLFSYYNERHFTAFYVNEFERIPSSYHVIFCTILAFWLMSGNKKSADGSYANIGTSSWMLPHVKRKKISH